MQREKVPDVALAAAPFVAGNNKLKIELAASMKRQMAMHGSKDV